MGVSSYPDSSTLAEDGQMFRPPPTTWEVQTKLLASAQPTTDQCSNLGSEPEDRRSLYVTPTFKLNVFKKKKTLIVTEQKQSKKKHEKANKTPMENN